MFAALFQGPIGSWDIISLLIFVVILGAVIALVYVALKQFGVTIPAWAQQCFWIVVVAFVVIFCIRLIAGM